MNPSSWEDIERLVERRIPEGPTLEYKRELDLAGDRARAEVLKDLSGMGNGGGGVVIYGIEELEGQADLPGAIRPLTDRRIASP